MVRRSLVAGLVCALAGTVGEARADDLTKEQCVEANESAQSLRQGGKLRAARAQLLICLAKTCPGPVRDDCAERIAELERAAPTIVFGARGPNGDAVHDVQITIDGARLADHLDGSALVVDPGDHVFSLSADGYVTVSKKLFLREGEKGRMEAVAFVSLTPRIAAAAPSPRALPAAPAPSHPPPDRTASSSSGGDQRTLALILGGVGVVGIGVGTAFGLYAKSTYDDAISNSSKCASGVSFCTAADVDRADGAHTQASVSTVAFVSGGALLAGGIVLFVMSPKDTGVTVKTSAGMSTAGLRVGGRW